MTDPNHDLYAQIRSGFAGVRMSAGLDAVAVRAAVQRRRRRTAVAAGGLVAAAVVSSLALILPTSGTPGRAPVGMALTAWSVDATSDGAITVTVRQLLDADRLSQTLGQKGVRSKIEFIHLRPGQVAGCGPVVQATSSHLRQVMDVKESPAAGGEGVFVIRPAAMPAGVTLHLVIFEQFQTHTRSAVVSLVDGSVRPCKPPQVSSGRN